MHIFLWVRGRGTATPAERGGRDVICIVELSGFVHVIFAVISRVI